MTETEFKQELKNLHGGYLLFGEEDYLKFSYSKEIAKKVLDGSFDEFNHVVIYGEEYTPQKLIEAITTLPMMSDKKLVEVRGLDYKSLKKEGLIELDKALTAIDDCDHTILVMRADESMFDLGRGKNQSEMLKMLSKHLQIVELDFPKGNRLTAWITKHFSKWDIEFDTNYCEYLVDYCGHDMWALTNEIDKLCSYALANKIKKVGKNEIEKVCFQTSEYDDFQLTNSLLEGNRKVVFETLKRQKNNHEPPNIILFSIVKMYSELYAVSRLYLSGETRGQISLDLKIHEFKVGKYINKISRTTQPRIERCIELCHDADIKSKSISIGSQYSVVENLVSLLCAI